MRKTSNLDKKAKGTDQPCRMDNEPVDLLPLTELPSPPSFANRYGKRFFKENGKNLMDRGILNEMNIEIYSILATEIGTYIEAKNMVKKPGNLVNEIYDVDKEGNKYLVKININPYQKIATESFKNITKLATEFGLTPTSVARIVSIMTNEKSNNPFDNF